MTLIEKLRQIERLDQLIRLKATGSPRELALRLDVSERKVFRIINEIKLMGFPVEYCKSRKSYVYRKDVKLFFELTVEEEEKISVKGGKKHGLLSSIKNALFSTKLRLSWPGPG